MAEVVGPTGDERVRADRAGPSLAERAEPGVEGTGHLAEQVERPSGRAGRAGRRGTGHLAELAAWPSGRAAELAEQAKCRARPFGGEAQRGMFAAAPGGRAVVELVEPGGVVVMLAEAVEVAGLWPSWAELG